ncbi:MAG: hypothetical protein JSW10_04905 [Pseudomonadota bacterium]|nr:MAG: hypothetical protein JSW10_04905 [Pseudomonadota bacterium]
MKSKWLGLVLLLLLPGAALAGNIYGTIMQVNAPPPQGTPVEVTCGSNRYRGSIGPGGSYSVYVRDNGACTLTVSGASQTVYSYPNPAQYDFVLNGNTLNRR